MLSMRTYSRVPLYRVIEKNSRYKLIEDVYQALSESIGGARYLRENVFSPYYNHIDFEVWQDESGAFAPLGEVSSQFVALKRSRDSATSDEEKWNKFAVVVNVDGDYTMVNI
jgi:hypothetical protein